MGNESEWHQVHVACGEQWERSYENSGYNGSLVEVILMKLILTRRLLLASLSASAQFDQWDGEKNNNT